jgi:hypothetical protein
MELLATVDWLLEEQNISPKLEAIRLALNEWPGGTDAGKRKRRLFDDRLIELALLRLAPDSTHVESDSARAEFSALVDESAPAGALPDGADFSRDLFGQELEPEKSRLAVELGRKGGKARAKSMSAERRSEIARKAARRRWKSKKQ